MPTDPALTLAIALAATARTSAAHVGLVISLVATLGAAVAVVVALRRRPGGAALTGPWRVVAAALAVWTVTFAARELLPETWRLPGMFAGHGVALMILGIGVAWLTWRWAGPDPIPVLDALILTAGFGLMAVVTFVPPMVAGSPLAPVFVWLIAAGGLVLGAALTYLILARVEQTRSAMLLAYGSFAALAATVAAETRLLPTVDDAPTAVVVVLHLVAVGLIGAATAWRPIDPRTPRAPHRAGIARLLLLGAGAAVGPGLLVVELASGRPLHLVEALAGAVALIAFIGVRTGIVVHRLERQTAALASLVDTDPVTALGNRARLVAAVAAADRGAVVLLDVDRFTELRDALGSRAADTLLRGVAARVTAAAGPDATVARIGSAVFGVLLPGAVGTDAAVGVARAARQACALPLELTSFVMEIDVFAGVVLLGPEPEEPEELLDRAEVALTVAALQPERVAVFGRQTDGVVSAAPVLVVELPEALARDELVVHYQPQVCLRTGTVFGLEALVRWQHPRLGLVGPAAFIPAAERTGLIGGVTRFVLERALGNCAQWRAAGAQVAVAVNLSVHDLLDPGLVERVREALARHGLPASALEVEVTETTAIVDPRRAVATLAALADLGVVVSVDDFGTGHSSLAYLQRLPVHRLKIDRAFVTGLSGDSASHAIVASTIDLAGRLGLEVVAEGVEDAAALGALRELGCHGAQGYHLSRPVPADQVLQVVRDLDARTVADQLPGQRTAGAFCA